MARAAGPTRLQTRNREKDFTDQCPFAEQGRRRTLPDRGGGGDGVRFPPQNTPKLFKTPTFFTKHSFTLTPAFLLDIGGRRSNPVDITGLTYLRRHFPTAYIRRQIGDVVADQSLDVPSAPNSLLGRRLKALNIPRAYLNVGFSHLLGCAAARTADRLDLPSPFPPPVER